MDEVTLDKVLAARRNMRLYTAAATAASEAEEKGDIAALLHDYPTCVPPSMQARWAAELAAHCDVMRQQYQNEWEAL